MDGVKAAMDFARLLAAACVPQGLSPGQIRAAPCIAREHAGCSDFHHCARCSTVEQALRAAAWYERHWPRARLNRDA